MAPVPSTDAEFMALALEEARKGQGRTAPNPCVGALVVRDGEIVGRGYHRKAGTPHAEVNALADAGERAASATLYVTLEPCNHTGRTPPCTEAILRAGIRRVVVGMDDPNPRVAGGGNAYLASRGLEVTSGVLVEECTALNRPFVKHSTTGLPWVAMKAGMSLDGRISYGPGQGGRITGAASQLYTHRLRNTFDAILIGVGTALIDDPSLTTRLLPEEEGRDPLRIVLDSHLRLPPDAKLLTQSSEAQTWVFCSNDVLIKSEKIITAAGARVQRVNLGDDNHLDLSQVLRNLGQAGITSVLVEGGAMVHTSLLRSVLVDEAYLFLAPMFIGEPGSPLLAGPASRHRYVFPQLYELESVILDEDVLIRGLFGR